MIKQHEAHVAQLNDDQRIVYHKIINVVNNNEVRSQRKIVLNVASNGITSLLLSGDRTTHSQFAIYLALNEDKSSAKAELLQYTNLIIWNKASIVSRWVFEVLDRTIRDIMCFNVEGNIDKLFGRKVVVLSDDNSLFTKWILDLGNGNLGQYNDGESDVEIPTNLLILNVGDLVVDIVSFTYPNLEQHFACPEFLKDKIILTPT
ncbi:hypothetical protein CR513_33202, partial [Mucuna pruriens]